MSGLSRKQTATSHSSTESELVAADTGMRTEAIPMLNLWRTLLRKLKPVSGGQDFKKTQNSLKGSQAVCRNGASRWDLPLIWLGDNQSALRMAETGKNPTMRHFRRTHGIALSWLHECYLKRTYLPKYVDTQEQAADIFTKHCTDQLKWNYMLHQIGITDFTFSE